MIEKAAAHGIPQTYTVRTGRVNGGACFLYRGKRTLPNCTGKNGFKVGELSGDIIHKGHVAAPGSLHKSGNLYRCINDIPFAPLPDCWRNYTNSKKTKATKPTILAEEWKRKLEAEAQTEPALKSILNITERQRADLMSGKLKLMKDGELFPVGRRMEEIKKYVGRLRALCLPSELVRPALDRYAVQKCWDGLNFIRTHKAELDNAAAWSSTLPDGDRLMRELSTDIIVRPDARSQRKPLLVAALREYPHRMIETSNLHDLLERALIDTGYSLPANRGSSAYEDAVREARQATGFTRLDRRGGVAKWVRSARPTAPQHITTDSYGKQGVGMVGYQTVAAGVGSGSAFGSALETEP